jgi:hypothetical protein
MTRREWKSLALAVLAGGLGPLLGWLLDDAADGTLREMVASDLAKLPSAALLIYGLGVVAVVVLGLPMFALARRFRADNFAVAACAGLLAGAALDWERWRWLHSHALPLALTEGLFSALLFQASWHLGARGRSPHVRRMAIAGGALVLVVFAGLRWDATRVGFDPALWRTSANLPGEDNPRVEMAERLVRSSYLIGKSRGEIATMLGPGQVSSDARDLTYTLGEGQGMFADGEWLEIEFDARDRVSDARIDSD